HHLPPDAAQWAEQLRAEASAELEQRRAAWETERKSLREQLERLQAERRTALGSGAQAAPSGNWEQEKQNLLQQLDHAHRLRRDLEEKMAARDRQAEQERSALEAEIEQLMERFLRMHEGRDA
ncbi:MAG: hypothetical protein WBD29_01330, partial [Candidatus Competibacter sp.]